MPVRTVVTSILDWLRTGYPDGVPPTDYFPLLALLQGGLNAEEVRAVAEEVARAGHFEVSDEEIGRLITQITNAPPGDQDLNRVRARLAAGGWPLADPRPVAP